MSPTRRDFIKTTGAAAAAVAASRHLGIEVDAQTLPAPGPDPAAVEIATEALNAARSAGASYADARVGRYRRQEIATRERQVSGVSDTESYGLGVRVLVDGCWGFAATSVMTRAAAQNAAQQALATARAARAVHRKRVELALVEGGEVLGFFRQGVERGDESRLVGQRLRKRFDLRFGHRPGVRQAISTLAGSSCRSFLAPSAR